MTTMESEDLATDSLFFDNMQVAQIVNELLADNNPPVGDEVYLTDEANPIGPGFFLPVIPGDRVEMSVYGYFDGGTGFNSTLPVENLTNELTMMFNAVNAGTELPLAVHEIIDDIFSLGYGAVGSGTEDDAPAAYLNYLMFDEEMNFIVGESGYLGISDSALAIPEHLYQDYSVNSRGYLFMYLSNESNESNISNAVYWDDLKITHHESPIVQTDDYYPFGLTFNSYQRPSAKKNDFLYNGKEMQDELDLGWLDYHARQYDPALGRMLSVDPLAEKIMSLTPYNYVEGNPISRIDPDGMESTGIQGLIDKVWAQGTGTYNNKGEKQDQESSDPIDDILVAYGISKTRKEMLLPLWKDILDGSIFTIEFIMSPSGKTKIFSRNEKILELISKAGDLVKLVNLTDNTYNKQVLYDYSRARLNDLNAYYDILQGIHQDFNGQLNDLQKAYKNFPLSADKTANAQNLWHYGKQIYKLSDKVKVVSQEINAIKILIHAREEERKIQK